MAENNRLGSFNRVLKLLPRPACAIELLDVGCGYGNHLVHFALGSVGLELGEAELSACRARGLGVYKWSFMDPFPPEISTRRFDAALLSHILEHVFSPHQILLELRRHLKPDGLLITHCPIVNPLDRMSKRLGDRYHWTYGFHGSLFGDHVNFFTTRTLRYTCEAAGFRTTYLGTPYLPAALAWGFRWLWPSAWYIGSKIDDFQYNEESKKLLDSSGRVSWKI